METAGKREEQPGTGTLGKPSNDRMVVVMHSMMGNDWHHLPYCGLVLNDGRGKSSHTLVSVVNMVAS